MRVQTPPRNTRRLGVAPRNPKRQERQGLAQALLAQASTGIDSRSVGSQKAKQNPVLPYPEVRGLSCESSRPRAELFSLGRFGVFLPWRHGDNDVVAFFVIQVLYAQLHLVLVRSECSKYSWHSSMWVFWWAPSVPMISPAKLLPLF